MSNKEKVSKAIEIIQKAGIKDEIVTADAVYEGMKDYSLYEIADEIAQFINLVYDLRDVLEAE